MSRILFFVSSMEGGGAERVAALLCNRWVNRGHQVMLVATYSRRGSCAYPLDERVDIVFLADRVGMIRRTPWSMLRRLLEMRRLVRAFHPDVVLSFLPHVNVATLLATRGLRLPVFVSERIYPVAQALGGPWRKMRRSTYAFAKGVVMQTNDGLAWLAKEVPKATGTAIPNPCVLPLPMGEPVIPPHAIVPDDRRLILAVGSLTARKQFEKAIDAFAVQVTKYPDWDLAIIGEGPERAALEAHVATAGLTERVHLPGRAGNIGDWYQRADLFVLSSRFEGFPNVLLEALAHGIPAVSFDCLTGPSELIKDGANGFLVVPEHGIQGLANGLSRLMDDQSLRDAFAEQAVKVRKEYAFDKVGAQWDRVLELDH